MLSYRLNGHCKADYADRISRADREENREFGCEHGPATDCIISDSVMFVCAHNNERMCLERKREREGMNLTASFTVHFQSGTKSNSTRRITCTHSQSKQISIYIVNVCMTWKLSNTPFSALSLSLSKAFS